MIDELMSKLGRSRSASRSPKDSAVDRLIELADEPKAGAQVGAQTGAQTGARAGAKSASYAAEESFDLHADPQLGSHLAIEEAPEAQDPHALSKALHQLKAIVPFLTRLAPLLDARFLPLLEMLGLGHGQQNQAANRELRDGVTGIQAGQKDLRVALHSQALEIQRLEDQVSRLRDAAEKTNLEHSELVEDVKSLSSVVRTIGAALAVLLVILILMVGLLLARDHS
ncbi:hypothetical protein [Silvibacterium sp.]|uniref:hypothetical protein n=1 Tax=Silvibacterium sp. TaxID=1964179 RepID=UPI0039E24192